MTKNLLKTIKLLFLILNLQLFTNCNYEFSEDYFLQIDQTEPNPVLRLEEFNSDIILLQPATVSYEYDGNNKNRLFEIRVYIDDTQILSSSNDLGTFYIDADSLNEGSHILKIEYLFSSGTNSLADINNLEVYIKTEEYNFYIDKSAPSPVVLKNVEIVDGTIYITWDPILETNFEEAFLIVKSNGTIINEIKLPQEVLLAREYNDKNSLCDNLNYSIKLINRYNQSISNNLTLDIDPISIDKQIVSENQLKLIWSKHPLYNNFDSYECNIVYPFITNLSPEGGELIVDKSPVFGNFAPRNYNNILHFYFQQSESVNNDFLFKSIEREVFFGKPFEKKYCEEYVYSVALDTYFALELSGVNSKDVYIHQLNPDDLSIIKSNLIGEEPTGLGLEGLVIDPISNDLIIDLPTKSYLIDGTSLLIKGQWNAEDFGITETYIKTHYRNNYILIDNLRTDELSIYNAETKEQIYIASRDYYFKVSDDGRYFYNNDGIYEIKNGVVDFITSTDTGSFIHIIEFMTDQNKCVYSNIFQNPVIFDFNTKSKTTLYQISEVRELQYDKKTQKLLFGQYHIAPNDRSFISIYDSNTSIFKKLEVYDDHYDGFYRFLNGKLIYSSGLYLDHYLD